MIMRTKLKNLIANVRSHQSSWSRETRIARGRCNSRDAKWWNHSRIDAQCWVQARVQWCREIELLRFVAGRGEQPVEMVTRMGRVDKVYNV